MTTHSDVVYMFAMSLDGFIARTDGSFDWLEDFPADDAFDFPVFEASVSGVIMGRGSYDAARRQDPWPCSRWPTLVATSRPVDDPPPGVQAAAGEPRQLLDTIRSMGADGRIWLFGGGRLAGQFLRANLLDTVEIGVIPVLLGTGIPAFGDTAPERWLKPDFCRLLANGALHVRYRVRQPAA